MGLEGCVSFVSRRVRASLVPALAGALPFFFPVIHCVSLGKPRAQPRCGKLNGSWMNFADFTASSEPHIAAHKFPRMNLARGAQRRCLEREEPKWFGVKNSSHKREHVFAISRAVRAIRETNP